MARNETIHNQRLESKWSMRFKVLAVAGLYYVSRWVVRNDPRGGLVTARGELLIDAARRTALDKWDARGLQSWFLICFVKTLERILLTDNAYHTAFYEMLDRYAKARYRSGGLKW